jgi:hypothetical protein
VLFGEDKRSVVTCRTKKFLILIAKESLNDQQYPKPKSSVIKSITLTNSAKTRPTWLAVFRPAFLQFPSLISHYKNLPDDPHKTSNRKPSITLFKLTSRRFKKPIIGPRWTVRVVILRQKEHHAFLFISQKYKNRTRQDEAIIIASISALVDFYSSIRYAHMDVLKYPEISRLLFAGY